MASNYLPEICRKYCPTTTTTTTTTTHILHKSRVNESSILQQDDILHPVPKLEFFQCAADYQILNT